MKSSYAIAVLFDLEDTLVQTPWSNRQHVLQFRQETREKLIELGIPFAVLEGVERSTLMRNKASQYVAESFSEASAQRFHQEMEKFLSGYEQDSAQKSKLFPETITVLESIRKLGVKIGLVTNTSRRAVDIVFQLHSLRNYFDVVVARDDVEKLKPNPEGILLAIERLGAKGFIMIGDLELDMSAAKSARGIAVLVKRNVDGESRFQADYVVQSLSGVPAIVQALTT